MLIHVTPEKSVFEPDPDESEPAPGHSFVTEIYDSLRLLTGIEYLLQADFSALFKVPDHKASAFCNVVENCGVFIAEQQ